MTLHALGIELDGELEEGWLPLEAVVTVKCLNSEGKVVMGHYASHNLNSFEAFGMAQWTADTLRNELRTPDEED